MYHVVCTHAEADRVATALYKKIGQSRFRAVVRPESFPRHVKVFLEEIRLRETKDYCGSHPGPCPLGGGRHKKAAYLEGSDWVCFNDMVNDVLDKLGHDDVAGSRVRIRWAGRRRINYADRPVSPDGRHRDWIETGDFAVDYEDWRGKKDAPRSSSPSGTPGKSGWRRKRKRRTTHAADAAPADRG